MSLGLKRNTVRLETYDPQWDTAAAQTIAQLKQLLGTAAVDIQHVGSTAVLGMPAKPIIDIAVGVKALEDMLAWNRQLEARGVVYRGEDRPGQLLYVMGDFEKDIRTHHIHVVVYGSTAWSNYINFRDRLNTNHLMAAEYADLKLALEKRYAQDRSKYTNGKQALIQKILSIPIDGGQ